MTLRVTHLRRTHTQDRTRSVQNGIPTQSVCTIVEVIVPTLQRRNAFRDALRHISAPHCVL
ncbi:DUF1534 domain-containing protein [Pseudomonas syringae pv. maculicola str. ES4326]|uniref:DUF1534 domain-containing protein n=1 Tax=Pseudomonas syringae pv. maculicola str. ES4326 TaxID=629265 RepID=A0A8T8C4P4_PSEYM|nr:DUF1534 domain-containing protein [Pseudomonas syringae pv. maculicola str. ES4326]